MDIQKKPTLAEKQEFWAEQLPNFESKYWLPSHFEFVVFDMNQGNYVIKDGLDSDLEDDATEIYHRVNTGWSMWKRAINFSRQKAQAVPEKDAIIKKLSDQLYSQEMKTSAARTLCETACELLDDYAHQDAMVILDDLEQAMKEPTND